MRRLKDFFNKSVKRPLIAAVATFATAFGTTAGASEPPEAPSALTYWKHPDYDIVVKLWECEDRGLCAQIDSADPSDPDNKMLMARLKGYSTTEKKSVGKNTVIKVRKPAPQFVADYEITNYEGFQPDAKLTQKGGKWEGTITSPFNGKTYGLDVEPKGADKLKLSGYFTGLPLFKLSVTADRVGDPPKPFAPPVPVFFIP